MNAIAIKTLLCLTTVTTAITCSKSDEKSCGEVATHVVAMLREELVKADSDTQKMARANLPTLQNSMMKTCDSQGWPQSSRLCILDAKTVADTVACKPEASQESSQGQRSSDPVPAKSLTGK